MRSFLFAVTAAIVVSTGAASAQTFGWTISGSSTDWIGFASDGSVPLENANCNPPDAPCLCAYSLEPPTGVDGDVEGSTWGRVKGLYR